MGPGVSLYFCIRLSVAMAPGLQRRPIWFFGHWYFTIKRNSYTEDFGSLCVLGTQRLLGDFLCLIPIHYVGMFQSLLFNCFIGRKVAEVQCSLKKGFPPLPRPHQSGPSNELHDRAHEIVGEVSLFLASGSPPPRSTLCFWCSPC